MCLISIALLSTTSRSILHRLTTNRQMRRSRDKLQEVSLFLLIVRHEDIKEDLHGAAIVSESVVESAVLHERLHLPATVCHPTEDLLQLLGVEQREVAQRHDGLEAFPHGLHLPPHTLMQRPVHNKLQQQWHSVVWVLGTGKQLLYCLCCCIMTVRILTKPL